MDNADDITEEEFIARPENKSSIKNFFIFTTMVIAAFGFFWFLKSAEVSISLDNIPENIEIGEHTRKLELTRGQYKYMLEKKSKIVSRRYIVTLAGALTAPETSKPAPRDAYSASFALSPYDDDHKGSIDLTAGMETAGSKGDTKKEKISASILAANPAIKETARLVKINDIIAISGMQFGYSKLELDGQKVELGLHEKNTDIIYATRLDIIE